MTVPKVGAGRSGVKTMLKVWRDPAVAHPPNQTTLCSVLNEWVLEISLILSNICSKVKLKALFYPVGWLPHSFCGRAGGVENDSFLAHCARKQEELEQGEGDEEVPGATTNVQRHRKSLQIAASAGMPHAIP